MSDENQLRQKSQVLIEQIQSRLSNLKNERDVEILPPEGQKNKQQEQQLAVSPISAALPLARDAFALFQSAIEVHEAIRQTELAVERYRIAAAKSREQLPIIAPIVRKELDHISERLDQVLDRALAIDVEDCTEQDWKYRTQLIEIASGMSDQIFALTMKLLSI